MTALCARAGAIMLTFTRANWTDDLLGLVRDRKMMLAALCEIVAPAGADFAEAPAWEEYLQAFCQMVGTTLPANYRAKAPVRKRAGLMAKVERLKKALSEHMRAAKDHVFASIDAGRGARLLTTLNKTQLGRLVGLKPYDVTRCFQADPQLDRMLGLANDPEALIRYGR